MIQMAEKIKIADEIARAKREGREIIFLFTARYSGKYRGRMSQKKKMTSHGTYINFVYMYKKFNSSYHIAERKFKVYKNDKDIHKRMIRNAVENLFTISGKKLILVFSLDSRYYSSDYFLDISDEKRLIYPYNIHRTRDSAKAKIFKSIQPQMGEDSYMVFEELCKTIKNTISVSKKSQVALLEAIGESIPNKYVEKVEMPE